MTACVEKKIHRGGNKYPTVFVNGRNRQAHVVAWEERHGPVPDGYLIHHLCENKACVNVTHLLAVTDKEHRLLHLKKACKHGHPLTEENVALYGGVRVCRECHRRRCREASRRWRERKQ
jgi:hypothetical protein